MKANIISRYTKNTFIEDINATVSCEFSQKSLLIDNQKLTFLIWDTCGQERYRSLTKSFFKNSNGVVIVFDLANYASFQNVNSWIEDAQEILGKMIPIVILANKSDIETNLKKVEDYEIAELAQKYSI